MKAKLPKDRNRDMEAIFTSPSVDSLVLPDAGDELARAHRPRFLGAPAIEQQGEQPLKDRPLVKADTRPIQGQKRFARSIDKKRPGRVAMAVTAKTKTDGRVAAASPHGEVELVSALHGTDHATRSFRRPQVVGEDRAHAIFGHTTRGAIVRACLSELSRAARRLGVG